MPKYILQNNPKFTHANNTNSIIQNVQAAAPYGFQINAQKDMGFFIGKHISSKL